MKLKITSPLLLLIGALSSFLIQCDEPIKRNAEFQFTYINSTQSDITIQGYFGNFPGQINEVLSTETLVQSFIDGDGNIIAMADSVDITIDALVNIRYRRQDGSPFNILDWENYEHEVVGTINSFTYTFLPEDFE